MKTKYYYVYILEMQNGNYYTGYTSNLKNRYEKHRTGRGARYTRAFKPVKIAAAWAIPESKAMAMRIESLIKKQKRALKENLVNNPRQLKSLVEDSLNEKVKLKKVDTKPFNQSDEKPKKDSKN